MNLDFTLIENASLLAFALVFLGGILTSIGPCNVAMIPLVVGYVGGSRDLPRSRAFVLSLTFAIGLALTFMLLGIAAALIGGLIGASTTWWYYLVAFVCFVIGLNMLGVLHIETPLWLGGLREKIALKGAPGALALGLVSESVLKIRFYKKVVSTYDGCWRDKPLTHWKEFDVHSLYLNGDNVPASQKCVPRPSDAAEFEILWYQVDGGRFPDANRIVV